jgi:hypothetical protein
MAASLAREFELFDQSLLVLSINRGDFERVINLISSAKDDSMKCK